MRVIAGKYKGRKLFFLSQTILDRLKIELKRQYLAL